MARSKVTVVGAGFVGSTTAQRLLEKGLADVVLVDVVEGLAQGKALDMMQSALIERFDTKIIGSTQYEETQNSDVIVITAGLARKPGMSRDDLLFKNAEIVSGIVEACMTRSPNAIILMVTNPLDVMTYLAWKISRFPTYRVLGMAGLLDSARYAHFVSETLHCKPYEVKTLVLGGHGDSMVPVPSQTFVNGKSLPQLLPQNTIETINQRTRDGGAEIVKYLKTGSAYYAPSSCAVQMVKAILQDTGEMIPSAVYLEGQYGLKDVYCGVPVRLGRKGVQEIIELPLSEKERASLQASAADVQANCAKLK